MYYVSAPPDVILLESDNLEDCCKVAAFNAKLSGNVILVVHEKTDKVVAVGVPPTVKVYGCIDPVVTDNMTASEVARILRKPD